VSTAPSSEVRLPIDELAQSGPTAGDAALWLDCHAAVVEGAGYVPMRLPGAVPLPELATCVSPVRGRVGARH
jgi:hypothetical protein